MLFTVEELKKLWVLRERGHHYSDMAWNAGKKLSVIEKMQDCTEELIDCHSMVECVMVARNKWQVGDPCGESLLLNNEQALRFLRRESHLTEFEDWEDFDDLLYNTYGDTKEEIKAQLVEKFNRNRDKYRGYLKSKKGGE